MAPFEMADTRYLHPNDIFFVLDYNNWSHSITNRLLAFQLALFDPVLQQEYREAYKAIPEHLRLPLICPEEDEPRSLEVIDRYR